MWRSYFLGKDECRRSYLRNQIVRTTCGKKQQIAQGMNNTVRTALVPKKPVLNNWHEFIGNILLASNMKDSRFIAMYDFIKNGESYEILPVKDMSNMFTDCSRLESLDLSGWDTSSIKCIDYMFDNCPAPYEVVDNKIVEKYI